MTSILATGTKLVLNRQPSRYAAFISLLCTVAE